jgi:hypothetical protein
MAGRRAAAVAGITVAAFASACCPSIAYSGTLNVDIEGAVAGEVEVVEVCTTAGTKCHESTTRPAQDGPWIVEYVTPERDILLVRLLDASGVVLQQSRVEPDWREVGGESWCGGPQVAAVVVGRDG